MNDQTETQDLIDEAVGTVEGFNTEDAYGQIENAQKPEDGYMNSLAQLHENEVGLLRKLLEEIHANKVVITGELIREINLLIRSTKRHLEMCELDRRIKEDRNHASR